MGILFLLLAALFGRSEPDGMGTGAASLLSRAAFAAETADLTEFVSKGKQFSALVPAGWERDESFFLNAGEECGIRLRAPDQKELAYVLIDIVYYGEAYRTPERFIFDRTGPSRQARDEVRAAVQDTTISGMKAKTFEIRSARYPIAGIGDAKVEAVEHYVVVPVERGFFVLLFNAPVKTAENYRPLFEKVLHSFKPSMNTRVAAGEEEGVTDEEYAVYTAFFTTKDVPDIDSPVPVPFPSKGRLVYEKTSPGKHKDRDLSTDLEKSFGKLDASLVERYRARNSKDWQLKDRIFVEGLEIFAEAKQKEIREQGGLGKGFAREFGRRYPVAGEIVYLSRVGFNKEMTSALFYAGSSSGLTGGGYLILMEKTGEAWRLKKAVLDDFWYY